MSTTLPVGSAVIVPAHDEAAVIARSLRALLSDGSLRGVTVVVACNGCSDATAEIARAVASECGSEVTVLELPVPSKVAAIRAAEALCGSGARLYLDADVECSGATAVSLLHATGRPGTSVAVPQRSLDLSAAGRITRAYYEFWQGLPWVQAQLAGRGAYALSAALRSTFDTFPDVQSDDRWATTRAPAEEAVVVSGRVVIRPPTTLSALLAVRTRVYAGNRDAAVPAHDVPRSAQVGVLLRYVANPRRWSGAVVFVAVTGVAKLRARRRSAQGVWGRDARRGGDRPERAGNPRAQT